jgi:hypothetical protein
MEYTQFSEHLLMKLLTRTLILAALMCVLGAAQAQSQGLSIQEQPDTARRYWCTYRSASGAAVSSREVFWTVRKPEVARVVAVPGTSRMRYVYVQALNLDSTVVVCSTIVSGVRYADSVPVKGEQVTKLVTVASGWPGAIVVPDSTLAALTIDPTAKSMAVGEVFKFTAHGWLSGASEPIETPVVWSATGGSVDQAGNYTAGDNAGTFVVRARSALISWRVDSAIVTVTVPLPPPDSTPPEPPVDMPNLPAGLSVLADYSGGSSIGNGINEITQATSLETDAGAPKSPSDVRRFNINAMTQEEYDALIAGTSTDPMGWQSGSGYVGVAIPAGGVEEFYVARWLRPSANMIGDPGGGNKSMMAGGTGLSIYWNWRDVTGGIAILPAFWVPGGRAQDPRNDMFLVPNRAQTPIVPGTWGLWETYVKLNTPGVANGILRCWANGVLQLEFTDLMFRADGSTSKFTNLKSDFYHNRSQLFPMWWDMDHMFVAGR